jgi:hypothetical protein
MAIALFAVSAVLHLASDAAHTRKGQPHVYAVEDVREFELSRERGYSAPGAPHLNFLRTWRSGGHLFLITEHGVIVYRVLSAGDAGLADTLGREHASRWVDALGQRKPAADVGPELEAGVFEDLAFGPGRVLWPATIMRWLALATATGGILSLARSLSSHRSASCDGEPRAVEAARGGPIRSVGPQE